MVKYKTITPKYKVIEHHFDYRREGYVNKDGVETNVLKSWQVEIPSPPTNSRRKIHEILADKRRSGDMPDTLSHWSVHGAGASSTVVGQVALTLWERQMEIGTANKTEETE